jgi:hypothetical protein
MADVMGVDLLDAVRSKMRINERRFPAWADADVDPDP